MDLGLDGACVCISGGTKGMGRAAAIAFAREKARVMSVVRCTRLAIPLMRKAQWGRVVNISSQSARIASSTECAYMTVKAGLNALSKNLAWTYAKENILINSVTPGSVASDAMAAWMAATGGVARGSNVAIDGGSDYSTG